MSVSQRGSTPQSPEPTTPYDEAAEQAFLGACLMDRNLVVSMSTVLEPVDFFLSSHATIWRVMLDLVSEGVPPDVVTLGGRLLDQHPTYDLGYLADLLLHTPYMTHGQYYGDRVHRFALARRMIHMSGDIATAAYTNADDPHTIIGRAEDALADVARRVGGNEYRNAHDIVDALEQSLGAHVNQRRVMSGVNGLDRLTTGFAPGKLVIIAARPSYGKSTLGLQIGLHAMRAGVHTLMVNAEMLGEETMMRLVTRWSGVTQWQQDMDSMNQAEREARTVAVARAYDLPVTMIDAMHGSLPKALSDIRRVHAVNPCGCVILDYLGLFEMGSEDRRAAQNRVLEVSLMTRALKRLAMEMQVPVVVLAQLSRAVEQRSSGRPQLSDLRESGSIEQDADVVIFIHRPGKAGEAVPESDAELIVAKHRGGATGSVPAYANDARFTFHDREVD